MLIDQDCIACIINQSVKVADAIEANDTLRHNLLSHVEKLSKDFSLQQNPPQIAAYVYKDMAKIAQKNDLYEEVKKSSTQKALSFLPLLQNKLSHSQNILETATKIAVAGNVIDLAAEVMFDLEEELAKIFDTQFADNDIEKLDKLLVKAKKVVVLGDNVGEHIFDYLYVQTLQKLYPNITFYYFVRTLPIINDVTLKEAHEAKFDKLCEVVDSGVDTPGFDYERASENAKKLFDEADLVLSKGMGNYECLSPSHKKNICFLLKVKCGVVANSLGRELGDIVCKIV